jgi:hypothetical protein
LKEEAEKFCGLDHLGPSELFERDKVTMVSTHEIVGRGSNGTF